MTFAHEWRKKSSDTEPAGPEPEPEPLLFFQNDAVPCSSSALFFSSKAAEMSLKKSSYFSIASVLQNLFCCFQSWAFATFYPIR
jgi:hypothetical protein